MIPRHERIPRKIYSAALNQLKYFHVPSPARILDIGSGNGSLIKKISTTIDCETYACDCTSNLMKLEDQVVDIVDLNSDLLPYADDFFDVVLCTEVIEHLENFRSLVREIYRVLKNHGVVILTTPNILNLKSRIQFLFSGFWNLFAPLPCHNRTRHSLSGHIAPISYFYISHAMVEAGFCNLRLDIDKLNKSSLCLLPVLYLPIKFFSKSIFRKVKRRYKTIDSTNSDLVQQTNNLKALLGRTIIVAGCKKTPA